MYLFEYQHFPKRISWEEKRNRYEKILSDALRVYAKELLATGMMDQEAKLLLEFADGKLPKGMTSKEFVVYLMPRFSSKRDPFVERALADLFCKVKDSGKPVYLALGAFHVAPIFESLEKRIAASGGDPKAVLELDSHALELPGVRAALEQGLTKAEWTRLKALVQRTKGK